MNVDFPTPDGIQQVITSQGILEEIPAWMISALIPASSLHDLIVYKKHARILLEILFPLHKLLKEGFVRQTNCLWIRSPFLTGTVQLFSKEFTGAFLEDCPLILELPGPGH